MKEDFNDIDRLFKEKLLNITPETALSEAELWNNVQSQLPKKRNRVIFWWIGALLLLIGFGAIAIYFSHQDNPNVASINSSTIIDSTQTKSNQSTKNVAATHENEQSNNSSSAALFNDSSAKSTTSKGPQKKSDEEFINNVDEVIEFFRSLSSDILIPVDLPLKGQEIIEVYKEDVSQIPSLQNDTLTTASGEVKKVFEIPTKKNPLVIGLYGIANMTVLQDRMNVRYDNQIGKGVGLSVGKSKNRLYWSAAAEWSDNKYLFNYETHERRPYTYYNFPVEIILDPGALPDTIFQDTTVMADYSRVVRHNNAFKAVSARMEIGRVFGASRVRPSVGLGLGIHYIYNQNGRYLLENNEVSLLEDGSLGLKKFTYSPFVKIGLEYKWNEKIAFNLSTRADWYSGKTWLNSGDKSIVVPAFILAVGYRL